MKVHKRKQARYNIVKLNSRNSRESPDSAEFALISAARASTASRDDIAALLFHLRVVNSNQVITSVYYVTHRPVLKFTGHRPLRPLHTFGTVETE